MKAMKVRRKTVDVPAEAKKPGPIGATVTGHGNWEDAIKAAIHKPRPIGGWPKPETKKRAAKK